MKKMTAARLDIFGCLMLMAVSVMPLDITDVELTEERGTIPSMKNPESRTDKIDLNDSKLPEDDGYETYPQDHTEKPSYSHRGSDVTGRRHRSRREHDILERETIYTRNNDAYYECYLCPAAPTGNAGTPGRPGYYGHNGAPGLKGMRGIPGPQGPAGDPGLPGRNGRDALSGSCGDQSKLSSATNSATPEPGVVFTRWGRTACPETSQLVYGGMATGTYVYARGGTSDISCLPETPQFSFPVSGRQSRRSPTSLVQYATKTFPSKVALNGDSIPCSVCLAIGRTAQIMVPGRNTCPSSEWTLEYSGYLQAAQKYRTATLCLDQSPQGVPADLPSEYGAVPKFTEFSCDNCTTEYTEGLELTCAVCTI